MYLIDIYSKEDLAKELSKNTNVEYVNNLSKVDFNTNSKLILINCAGKEGGDDKELKTVTIKEYEPYFCRFTTSIKY